MHLLNTSTKKLQEFSGPDQVKYAILSHRWTEEEVTFEDANDFPSCSKKGVSKISSFCEIALRLGYQWCWVDTCCINKSSSAELSEAINSMFSWYQNASVCIVYLQDVASAEVESMNFESEFRASTWFLRSWTLQELLASANHDLSYYNTTWQFLGSGMTLSKLVARITAIDEAVLLGNKRLSDYCIAERMSWASMRSATRIEDIAYSLLGIFDIQMPLVYGEGPKAFRRLQQAIMLASDDETIFAWDGGASEDRSILAPSPSCFAKPYYLGNMKTSRTSRSTYELMSRGVKFDSAQYVRADPKTDVLLLNVVQQKEGQSKDQVGIYLRVNQGRDGNRRVWLRNKDGLWLRRSRSRMEDIEDTKSFYIPFDHDEPVLYDLGISIQPVRPAPQPTRFGYDFTFVPPGVLQISESIARQDRDWLWVSKDGGPVCNLIFRPPFHGISVVHLGVDRYENKPVLAVLPDTGNVSQSSDLPRKVETAMRDFSIDYSDVKAVERMLLPDRINERKDWYIQVWPRPPLTEDTPWYEKKLWQHPKLQPDLNYFFPFPSDPTAVQGKDGKPVTSYIGYGIELVHVSPGKWKFGLVKFSIVSNWASKLNKTLVSRILGSRPMSLTDTTYSIDLDTFKSLKTFHAKQT